MDCPGVVKHAGWKWSAISFQQLAKEEYKQDNKLIIEG
jgi:hypothetical protein